MLQFGQKLCCGGDEVPNFGGIGICIEYCKLLHHLMVLLVKLGLICIILLKGGVDER